MTKGIGVAHRSKDFKLLADNFILELIFIGRFFTFFTLCLAINGVPFDQEAHSEFFAGRPVDAIRKVTSYQTQEGFRALWMGTRKHMTVPRWRRRVGHSTMNRILQREMIRRVSFVKKASATNEGFAVVRSTSNYMAKTYM